MVNPWDQYRTAREVFREVRTDARSAAGGLPVDYLAVGHSLGGGLARHMAASFPCVTAIAFNSSFVANDFRLKEPYVGPGTRALPDRGRVVDIFENRDLLSRLALLWDPTGFFKNDHQHQWYRINLANDLNGQHSIYATAAGMASTSFHCLERPDGCSLARDGYGQDALRKVSRQSGDDLETRKLWCLGTPAIKAEERQKIVNECRPYFGQTDASATPR